MKLLLETQNEPELENYTEREKEKEKGRQEE
jgi:hypothetical protein